MNVQEVAIGFIPPGRSCVAAMSEWLGSDREAGRGGDSSPSLPCPRTPVKRHADDRLRLYAL
jgi:hypothetical protein